MVESVTPVKTIAPVETMTRVKTNRDSYWSGVRHGDRGWNGNFEWSINVDWNFDTDRVRNGVVHTDSVRFVHGYGYWMRNADRHRLRNVDWHGVRNWNLKLKITINCKRSPKVISTISELVIS